METSVQTLTNASRAKQMPVGSSCPSLANDEWAPDLPSVHFRVHIFLDICSSPEVRFSPLCQRVSSKYRPASAPTQK